MPSSFNQIIALRSFQIVGVDCADEWKESEYQALSEWIAIKDNIHNTEWMCSNCYNHIYNELDPWITDKYCRKCGRKMRVPRKENGLYLWDDVKKVDAIIDEAVKECTHDKG